jgi:hypothetical protein
VNALLIAKVRVARSLAKHAANVSPGARAEWAQGMINELDYLSPEMPAIGWALGCLCVCYTERIRVMIRSLTALPRWILALEMLLCFLPPTLLFSHVVSTEAQGGFTMQAFLLYCSGSIIGPLGLAAAFRSIFFRSGGMSRTTSAALCLLAAWTLAAYSAQILTFGQTHLADWWREFVFIAVLPSVAALHLVAINSKRRGEPLAA